MAKHILEYISDAILSIENGNFETENKYIKRVATYLGDLTPVQTVLFLVVFELTSSGANFTTFDSIAAYTRKTHAGILRYIADFRVLAEKGFFEINTIINGDEELENSSFRIRKDIVGAIIENKSVKKMFSKTSASNKKSLRKISKEDVFEDIFGTGADDMSPFNGQPVIDENLFRIYDNNQEFAGACGSVLLAVLNSKADAPADKDVIAKRVKEIERIKGLEMLNRHLSIVHEMKGFSFIERVVFYQQCDFTQNVGGRQIFMKPLQLILQTDAEVAEWISKFLNGECKIVTEGFITIDRAEDLADYTIFLGDRGTELLFGKNLCEPFKIKKKEEDLKKKGNIKAPEDIVGKELVFCKKTQEQYDEINYVLQEKNYQRLVKNLKEAKLLSGLTCLFFGESGTGKTESSLQLAKASGRKIISVNIEDTKSQWYAESEKKIAEVFDNYYEVAAKEKLKPILLFNEADAVFANRVRSATGTEQTDNRIIDILLNKLDTWEGILFATTNNQDYLDKAFYRRFLYKMEFEFPDEDVRYKLLMTKIPGIKENEAKKLAKMRLSGSNIDNIVKKLCIAKLKHKQTFELMERLCEEELSLTGNKKSVGFTNA